MKNLLLLFSYILLLIYPENANAQLHLLSPVNETEKQYTVGNKISGDFNGDGEKEFAYLVKVKEGYGNPVDDDDAEPDEWEVQFSDKSIQPISVVYCGGTLIAEGDLNNDKTDEITVYHAPMNGCTGIVETYTIKTGNWKPLFEPFAMFYCAELTDEEFEKLVEVENGSVSYHSYDPNNEDLLNDEGDKIRFEKLVKHKAKLL